MLRDEDIDPLGQPDDWDRMVRRITRTLIWVFVIIAAYLVLLVLVTIGAKAHDIYKDLQQPGSSMKCCGGEGPNADCEALDHTQIHEQNGSFVIDSKRYGRSVLLGTGRIVWSGIPGEKPGTAGHWCGKPRSVYGLSMETSDDQPDPTVWTFCAWINPGGV